MPKPIVLYVRFIDALNRRVGRFAMYLIFAMMGILLYSALGKTLDNPPLWTLEMAQFTMVGYYLLGGGYSMQLNSHVRMDLFYGAVSDRKKAGIDALTIIFLIFYLCVLLYGGYSATEYAVKYGEESYSSWAPPMAPVKIVMVIGVILMLLQAVATFFKDLAKATGRALS